MYNVRKLSSCLLALVQQRPHRVAAQLAQLHGQVAHARQVLGCNTLEQVTDLLGVQGTVVPTTAAAAAGGSRQG